MHPKIPKNHSNIALPDLLSGLMLIINFNNFLINQLTVATLIPYYRLYSSQKWSFNTWIDKDLYSSVKH